MTKLLIILSVLSLTSCGIIKHNSNKCNITKHNHYKDPVDAAVYSTMKKLKQDKIIN